METLFDRCLSIASLPTNGIGGGNMTILIMIFSKLVLPHHDYELPFHYHVGALLRSGTAWLQNSGRRMPCSFVCTRTWATAAVRPPSSFGENVRSEELKEQCGNDGTASAGDPPSAAALKAQLAEDGPLHNGMKASGAVLRSW